MLKRAMPWRWEESSEVALKESLRRESDRHAAVEEYWRQRGEDLLAAMHAADVDLIRRVVLLGEQEEQFQKRREEQEEQLRVLKSSIPQVPIASIATFAIEFATSWASRLASQGLAEAGPVPGSGIAILENGRNKLAVTSISARRYRFWRALRDSESRRRCVAIPLRFPRWRGH
jgi:hypothetical protein